VPWEAEVQENGKLFYIETYPQPENSGVGLGQSISTLSTKTKPFTETPSSITPGW